MKALLVLEDGKVFPCKSFTGPGESRGEVVFNTGMTGYQEVLTDPSYKGQMVTMTYPLIGNYGVNPEDAESDRVQVAAFIIREYQSFPSNFRSVSSLADYLKKYAVMGIEELDTRALTRHLRNAGAMRGFISTEDRDPASLLRRVRETPHMAGQDLVKSVTTAMPYYWEDDKPRYFEKQSLSDRTIWKHRGKKFSVVTLDFGVKYSILRCMAKEGCEIIVVPASTDTEIIRRMEPEGIFLSNGPGDPEPLTYAVETVRNLLDYRPMFGICLGQQVLGLALGGKTFKLKFGHRGINQPVKNMENGRIEITSQNHGFSVDTASLDMNQMEVTHMNLNDNTLEGFRHKQYPLFSVQYHPEASPGPHDARYLFRRFGDMMREGRLCKTA
ncbi:MAG: glutamine-hydrolyzing carbamoyl-phosphate synthase small subunit [Desulfococcaceae bacterium]|jgi:carbamoyl-phosphate synthase small subunit|nr:glutamine-hydrolyzing carbamoyl-phosphate synthase small subunit [Desulfococcaceae bacterium]